ncbi:MAG: hypothetical protein RLY98_1479 [Bacteroidota bacterium]|jgi:hypothetical protein
MGFENNYQKKLDEYYKNTLQEKSFSEKFQFYLQQRYLKYQNRILALLNKRIGKSFGKKKILLKFVLLFVLYLIFFTLNNIFLDANQTKYLWVKFKRTYPELVKLLE